MKPSSTVSRASAEAALSGGEAQRLVQAVPGVLMLVRGRGLAHRHVSSHCESPRLAAWAAALDELPGPFLEVVEAARRARGIVGELELEGGLVVRLDAVALSDDEVALHVLDVSEQRRVEEQVLASERARLTAQHLAHRVATERLSSLATVAAGVGHEVNNPLTWVASSLEFIRRELVATTVSAELREALDEAEEGVGRITAIVRDLRVLSGPAGPGPPEVVAVVPAVRAAMQATAGAFRGQVPAVLHVERPLEVYAHEGNLVWVLVNLLANAAQALVKAAPAEDRVDVRVMGPVEGRVVIEVRDTGRGMDRETLARAFDPFFTTRPVNAGVGLGLAVARALVEAMGGWLELESAPGAGTIARVRLPSATTR
ncbi:MAG: ATP-binding protein [Myxococcaceae bacterium]|nr:ATP-binding protein [Myxococcaceae bacterium]